MQVLTLYNNSSAREIHSNRSNRFSHSHCTQIFLKRFSLTKFSWRNFLGEIFFTVLMAYVVLTDGIAQLQNIKKYGVFVGESSTSAAYSLSSTKPLIHVTVTATASTVSQWLSSVLHRHREKLYAHHLVIGLGVQWTHPNTIAATTSTSTTTNNPNHSTADTLQLCIGNDCLIFQLEHADMIPENLRKFLMHRRNTFVGFWNNGDRWRLVRSMHCLELFRYPMDLRYKAIKICNENLSVAKLDEIARKCLGFQVEQRTDIGMSNWGQLNLDLDQIAYASVDAFCASEMGDSIEAWRYKDE